MVRSSASNAWYSVFKQTKLHLPMEKTRVTITFSTILMKSTNLLFCVFPNFLIKLCSYTILLYKLRLGYPFFPHYQGIPSEAQRPVFPRCLVHGQ